MKQENVPPLPPSLQPSGDPGLSPSPQPIRPRVTIQSVTETVRVTYIIMGFTILVYIFQMISQFLLQYDLPAYYGLKSNVLIVDGEWWRLLTPMFLHGSIIHIGFNMYALNILGPELERHLGTKRFLALYILSGLAGNIASMAFSKANSLGSSTAIFGLLGAHGVFIYQNRQFLGARGQAALRNVLYIAGINLLIGLSPGIDNWGHMGGLAGGILLTWFTGPVFQAYTSTSFHNELGIPIPEITLVDKRDAGDIIRATIWIGVLLVAIAIGVIMLQTRFPS